jgi:hypothetical protein
MIEVSPKLMADRFDQFQPGDLFLFQLRSDEPGVALVAEAPSRNGEKMSLVFGPRLPGSDVAGPRLTNALGPDVAGASFGKEFSIKLPVDAAGWTRKEPAHNCPTLLVMGAKIYFRATWEYDLYFIDASNGLVESQAGIPLDQSRVPRGPYLFAVAWEIVTTEPEPRCILRAPFPEPAAP